MTYSAEMKRARALATSQHKYEAKQIVQILDLEFEKFKTLTKKTKLRNVYRWIKGVANVPGNWIDKHQARYRKLPKLPERIGILFENYSYGMRVTKRLKLKKAPPSMQYWRQVLLPTEREKFLELLQWLGHDREGFEVMIKHYHPGTSTESIRLIPKRKIA